MAEEVIEYEFDPIFGTRAKKKLVKESEELGEKSGKRFADGFSEKIRTKLNKSLTSALTAPFKNLSAQLITIGAGVAGGFLFKRAVEEASELESSLIGLKSVGAAFGIEAQRIEDTARGLAQDGLVPLSDVTSSLKNLVVNFNGDLEKSVQVFDALKNAAAFNRQGALSLGEAIRGASEGLKNDLSIKVDNAGVTKNLSIIYKEYAASIGTTIGRLTSAQKAQAEYVGILKEASIFQGDYNRLIQTFNGAAAGFRTGIQFLLASLGGIITKSPAVIALINAITTEINNLTKFITTLGGDGFQGLILQILEVGKGINSYIIKPMGYAMNAFVLFKDAGVFVIDLLLNKMASLAQGFLDLLPDALVSDRLANLAEGIRQATDESIGEGLKTLVEDFQKLGNTETADAIEGAINRVSASVAAASPNVKGLSDQIKKLLKGFQGTSNGAKNMAKTVNDAVNRALAKSASLGIQALTKSLLLGEKGFKDFGKKIAGVLGDMAIQLGETLILSGLGIEALKSLGGAAAIAAGAGLIALGTILKSFSGGGAGAGGAGAGGGGIAGTPGASAGFEDPIEEELAERAEPETRVNLTIQGDVLDSEESGLRIAQLLEEASLNQNVRVQGF